MDYRESVCYLEKCALLGSKPGLDTVTELLKRLGFPQDSLRIIHLAGTNGKGSVGCFLQSVLKTAGYRVGFFTSPFLFARREMIQIGGEQISEIDFASFVSKVGNMADEMENEGLSHPTEFEIMTAVAYLFFAEKKCDYVVIEAGMGGEKDATNVMRQSEVSVLTRIDYDHLQFLGATLSEITQEKCGIFRAGVPVVVYPCQERESLLTIENEAEKRGAELVIPLKDSIYIEKSDRFGSVFSYGKFKNIQISLCGKHQILNAVTALMVLLVLREKGAEISDKAIHDGFLSARWEGRFEILSQEPPVLLDGAHNVNGAIAFSKAVWDCFGEKKFIGVVGMLRDKDFETSLFEFSKVCRMLILTEVPNPRSASAEELLQAANKLGISATTQKNPAKAVSLAFRQREKGEGILCVGSLYALPIFKESCQRALGEIF